MDLFKSSLPESDITDEGREGIVGVANMEESRRCVVFPVAAGVLAAVPRRPNLRFICS